jgi:hypothetical protein
MAIMSAGDAGPVEQRCDEGDTEEGDYKQMQK